MSRPVVDDFGMTPEEREAFDRRLREQREARRRGLPPPPSPPPRRQERAADPPRRDRGSLGAVRRARSEKMQWDPFWAGLLQGAPFNLGDELFGDLIDFHGARGRDPFMYDLATGLGAVGTGFLGGRQALGSRERMYRNTLQALDTAGVMRGAMPRPQRNPIPFAGNNRDFRGPIDSVSGRRPRPDWTPDIPSQMYIDDVAQTNPTLAPRLAQERAQGIAQSQELLPQRRQALDDWATGMAATHGAAFGLGGGFGPSEGDDIGERLTADPLERILGAAVSAPLAYGAIRAAPHIIDATGFAIRPFQGRPPWRFSAEDVVGLANQRGRERDVPGVLRQLRLAEEDAARSATGDMRFGRAAEPMGDGKHPYIAALDDESPMVKGFLGAAARSPTGQAQIGQMDDALDIATAQDRIRGLQMKGARPAEDAFAQQPYMRQLPNAAINDPMTRPHVAERVMGSRKWMSSANDERIHPTGTPGEFETIPSLLSPGQQDRWSKAARPGTQMFDAMNPAQKAETAYLFIEQLGQETQALAGLPPAQQAVRARELLQFLDDGAVMRVFADIGLREGAASPTLQKMMQFKEGLAKIATNRMTAQEMLINMKRADGSIDPGMQDAAQMLEDYPMERGLAQAALSPQALNTPADIFHLNPAERAPGANPFRVRKQAGLPPWPYGAPQGVKPELLATAAAVGGDKLVEALLEAVERNNAQPSRR